jgi:hypothetical protein
VLFAHDLTHSPDHAGVYVPSTGEILIYGGKAYLSEQPKSNQITWPYKVADDMWYYNFNHCVNNCSLHGDCRLGFCEVTPVFLPFFSSSRHLPPWQCYVGYYGIDCSNISCPGTFCYYDSDSHEQVSLLTNLSHCLISIRSAVMLVKLGTTTPTPTSTSPTSAR